MKRRTKRPEPTYVCTVCGWQTKHARFVFGRKIITQDHKNVRDCLRHLSARIYELEWRE